MAIAQDCPICQSFCEEVGVYCQSHIVWVAKSRFRAEKSVFMTDTEDCGRFADRREKAPLPRVIS
jgi:hypothetical protein